MVVKENSGKGMGGDHAGTGAVIVKVIPLTAVHFMRMMLRDQYVFHYPGWRMPAARARDAAE